MGPLRSGWNARTVCFVSPSEEAPSQWVAWDVLGCPKMFPQPRCLLPEFLRTARSHPGDLLPPLLWTDRVGPRSHFLNSHTFANRHLTPTPRGAAFSSGKTKSQVVKGLLQGRTARWSQNQNSEVGAGGLRAQSYSWGHLPGAPPGLLPGQRQLLCSRVYLCQTLRPIPPHTHTHLQTCFSWGLSWLAAPLRSRLEAALPRVQPRVTWLLAAFPGALNPPPLRLHI